MRTHRTLAFLGASCLSVIGCGTTRAYDGPERPAAELAHVECQQEGGGMFANLVPGLTSYAPYGRLDARVESVGSKSIGSSQVDLLPGRQEMSLHAGDPQGYVSLGGSLAFEAQAGKQYEVRVIAGTHAEHVFAIREKGATDWLATSERAIADFCPIAAADWLGEYEIIDGSDQGQRTFVSWVPKGKTLADCSEMLEVFREQGELAESFHPSNPAWREHWQEEMPLAWHTRTIVAWDKDWMAFTYTGEHAPRKELRHGFGVRRAVGDRLYTFYFERMGAELESGDAELWQKRFLEVALR